MSHIRFQNDDDDEFELSDSEDEYTDHDKSLLNKVRQSRKSEYSDDEDEVFNIQSEDESDQSNIALSDIDGQDDDDLPDSRAWGKDKRNFYSTDYVDPDYGGFQGKDAALADLEEQEARNLQLQLAQQLDDDDFSLEVFDKKPESTEVKQPEEVIKTDITQLSNRQKIQLLQKESPEFFGLVDDFKAKITIMKDYLKPILNKSKNGKIRECEALDFVKKYHQLILNYCTNIYMYLLLKSSKTNMQNHPVIKRLYQYRQLLVKMESVFDEVIKAQIILLLEEQNDTSIVVTKKKKTLKLLSNLTNTKPTNIEDKENKKEKEVDSKKKVTFNINEEAASSSSEDEIETVSQKVEETENNIEYDGDAKRGITYQIAKNKGLMPRRKKEQRNPRVKHRNKFRKAKIRRKGAVREVRTEMKRYGGEISGIKSSVVKSVKIKS